MRLYFQSENIHLIFYSLPTLFLFQFFVIRKESIHDKLQLECRDKYMLQDSSPKGDFELFFLNTFFELFEYYQST
jgi:hypothetical protein